MIVFLILTGLAVGLWLGRWPWYIGLVIGIISFIYAAYRFRLKGCVILLGCLVIGGGLSLLDTISPPIQERYEGIVVSSKENYFLFYSKGHRYYVYEKNNERELGDYLKIEGTINQIKFTTYESRFDFGAFLNDKGVRFELRPRSVKIAFANPFRIKSRKRAFLEHFDETSASLLDALLFSTRNNESELIQNASSMNLIFLFSMCGIYLRSLMSFLEYLLKLKFSDRFSRIATLIIVLPLLGLSFEKLAVHRLLSIYCLRIANDYLFKTKLSHCSLTALIGLGFLCFDYHLVYQASFLMGFGLSFLMIFLRSPIGVFPRRVRQITLILLVFVFLLPIHIAMTHEIHLFQIIFQCLATPLNTIFFMAGSASFFIAPWPEIMSVLAKTISGTLIFLARFDASIVVGEVPYLFYFAYYGVFIGLLYTIEGHRIVVSKKLALSLILILSMTSLPIRHILVEAVHFINVGQGDAILIQNHETNILVDTGGNLGFDMAAEVLIPFFRKKMVRQIDYLITTHDDFDHNGAANSLKNLFPVKKEVVDSRFFPLVLNNLTIENINTISHEDNNDSSLVLLFQFMNRRWLLMGDASSNVEKEIMLSNPSLDIDILKIGHHGSKTSTSDSFINKITPTEAIISVAANNYYGHPHTDVLNILSRYRVTIRRTDLEGTISYYRYGF